MNELGCTTPFDSKDHSNICKDDRSFTAMKNYQNVSQLGLEEGCKFPCNLLKMSIQKNFDEHNEELFILKLGFQKFIKVTNAYYSYQGLELIAEFGGYVGLFLGVSIVSLKDVFKYLINCFFSFGKDGSNCQ